jgi:hypothetical protein
MKGVLALLLLLLASVPAAYAQPGNWIVYGANSDRQIFSIDLTSAVVTSVGNLPVRTQAIEQDPASGFVYYYERTLSGDEFGYWNPATGTSTLVRRYTSLPGLYAKRLAISPAGAMYLMDDTDVLWAIDKVNGDLTHLGKVAGLVTGEYMGTGDMTFGPDGTLYLNTYEHVYTVDIGGLRADPLHLNALAPGQIGSGLAYCDGALYASVLDEPAAIVRIVRIEVVSGAVSPVANGLPVLNDLSTCLPGAPPAQPAAPSWLLAQATATNRVALQWADDSSDEIGFRIERRLGAGPYQYVGTVGAGVRTFTSSGLTPGTTYSFRVYAFNNGGSAYSDEATVTTPTTVTPPTVQLLTPTAGTVYSLGAAVAFSADGADLEDGPLPNSAFLWEIVRSGGSYQVLATGVRSGSVVIGLAGTYTIRVTVTDSSGRTARAQAKFTVR